MKTDLSQRLFVGISPGGIVYADRGREVHGDYQRLAFLPYDTLVVEWSKPRTKLRRQIEVHALGLQQRRGEQFTVSTCGQSVLLGKK